jgi:DNA repair protein RadC
MRPGLPMSSVSHVRDFLRVRLALREPETFSLLLLDTQNRLIAYRELFRGTLAHTAVHAREVVKEALAWNAAGVILCHNHPSGRADPSAWDVQLTRLLQRSLALVDVRVVDHFVVGGCDVTSFVEEGLL